MSNFSLYAWTACQDCDGNTLAYVMINNNTNSSKSAKILIAADQNNDDEWEIVANKNITIEGNSTGYMYLNTNIEGDYTGKIQFACYYDNSLEFYDTKSCQEIEPYGNCPTQEDVSNVVPQCNIDGSTYITWNAAPDAFIYDIFRYKNNVRDKEFYYLNKYNYFTDNISNCDNSYSYGIRAISYCLVPSNEIKVNVIPYEEPEPECSIPVCNFIIS